MLRLAFWSLLILNAFLYAYAEGYVGNGRANEHEPERLNRQFNTAKLTLLPHDQSDVPAKSGKAGRAAKTASAAPAPETAPAAPAAPAPEPAAVAKPAAAPAEPARATAAAFACTEAGPFNESEARRFETRIAPLDLGARLSRQEVEGQDVKSWLVNIPPQPTREAAERKAAELRELGVTDFYIMPADSAMKYAISLGMFKTESGAQAMLASLNKQGLHTARITPRGPQTTHLVYRLRNLDAATRERIADIAGRLGDGGVRDCGATR